MSGQEQGQPHTLREKAAQFLSDVAAIAVFVLAAGFMFVTGWYMLDLRNSWLFGWLPF